MSRSQKRLEETAISRARCSLLSRGFGGDCGEHDNGDRLVYGLELENESSSRGEEPGVASFKLGVWSGGS